MRKIAVKIFKYILLIILSYAISYLLLSGYVQGDQVHYQKFYNLIYGVPFFEVGPIALTSISSAEPISWFILWIGSNLDIPKIHWISFLNVLLIAGIYICLVRFKAPWYVFFLIFTNFYLVVLITAAERLKISYIILMFAFFAKGKLKILFLLISPVAHFQSLLTLFSLFLSQFSKDLQCLVLGFTLTKRLLLFFGFSIFAFSLFFFFFHVEIFNKASYYINANKSILGLANISLFFAIAMWVARDRWRMFLAFGPFFFAAYLLGGERVNMMAIILVLGILLIERRIQHPLIIILLSYFSLKTIPFAFNIYKYGNGFGGPLW